MSHGDNLVEVFMSMTSWLAIGEIRLQTVSLVFLLMYGLFIFRPILFTMFTCEWYLSNEWRQFCSGWLRLGLAICISN